MQGIFCLKKFFEFAGDFNKYNNDDDNDLNILVSLSSSQTRQGERGNILPSILQKYLKQLIYINIQS